MYRKNNFILLFLAALFQIYFLLSVSHSQTTGHKLPKWAEDRLFSVSSSSPLVRHMVKHPKFVSAAVTLTRHIEHF